MHKYFVTGIGTDIGKTIVSAVLCEKLQAAYYKPIQSGNLDKPESEIVNSLVANLTVFPSTCLLSLPMSPHAAAKHDGVSIQVSDFSLPDFQGNLVVEGAGGILVPLNQRETILDLMKAFDLPVILVVSHYLGSINHTLLSIAVLKLNNIKVHGVIFNGHENLESESIILEHSGVRCLGHIPFIEQLNAEAIHQVAEKIRL